MRESCFLDFNYFWACGKWCEQRNGVSLEQFTECTWTIHWMAPSAVLGHAVSCISLMRRLEKTSSRLQIESSLFCLFTRINLSHSACTTRPIRFKHRPAIWVKRFWSGRCPFASCWRRCSLTLSHVPPPPPSRCLDYILVLPLWLTLCCWEEPPVLFHCLKVKGKHCWLACVWFCLTYILG